MILRTRAEDVGGLWSAINTEEITRASRLVSRMTGYVIQPNKGVTNSMTTKVPVNSQGMVLGPLPTACISRTGRST